MRAQVTNGRTTRRREGGAGDWPGEWQQLDGHGGGNIHCGGFGAGGGGVGCNTYRNKLMGEVCPNIGSGCHVGFCQDPGQARRVYSCFDSCTFNECHQLAELLWQDGVEWASCEWHGGVQPDFPPTVALFTHFPCPSAAGSAFQDCLCSGLCLDECIQYLGAQPCTSSCTVLGTRECVYYDNHCVDWTMRNVACYEYYCIFARDVCPLFGNSAWARCTRYCLQKCDQVKCNWMCFMWAVSPTDTWAIAYGVCADYCHRRCYAECFYDVVVRKCTVKDVVVWF